MKNWDPNDNEDLSCDQEDSLRSAQFVANELKIPLVNVDFVREYWTQVFEPFVSLHGDVSKTGNPDVACNREIKFNAFRKHCMNNLGCDYVATGHYARLDRRSSGEPRLLRGIDEVKDQSYFLSSVRRRDFANVLFPLGETTKSEIREIAKTMPALRPAEQRKESYGICFVGTSTKKSFGEFLSDYVPNIPGEFIDAETGESYGPHNGALHYTIGQKARIDGMDRARYVSDKRLDGDCASIVVAPFDHPSLFSSSVLIDASFFAQAQHIFLNGDMKIKARLRYREDAADCVATRESDTTVRLDFDSPRHSVTPGQFAALYDATDVVCLGGGEIL